MTGQYHFWVGLFMGMAISAFAWWLRGGKDE